jgi:seryl-tRNA synthetase
MAGGSSISDFHQGLIAHGLVLPSGVKGVFGRGAVFEDILQRFDALVQKTALGDHAEPLTFPPVLPRALIEKLGYLDNFPQLAGAVHSFFGNDAKARELSTRVNAGQTWDDFFGPTEVMLTPAACYPVYPTFSGLLPAGGRTVTVLGWVFRHEPSDEATRLQSFRMREYIRVGAPDVVLQWRNEWLQRGLRLLCGLGLAAKSDVASDPFFGRVGKMMAANQIDQRLKFEILVPVISDEHPTAICSFNWHQEHFTSIFGVRNGDSSVAHTACLGFGMERVTMALIKTHGFEPERWPREVREQLWP